MSADNWAVCPKCLKKANDDLEKAREKLNKAYGIVPSIEYLKMFQETERSIESVSSYAMKAELREEYEIGIDENNFYVSYSASCQECGFKYSYQTEEKIK